MSHPRKQAPPGGRLRRGLSWIRDGWCVVSLAVALFLVLDWAVAAWQGSRPVERVLDSSVYRAAAGIDRAADLAALIDEVAATHDSPFVATHLRWEPLAYWRSRTFDGQLIRVDAQGLRRTIQAPPGDPVKNVEPLVVCCFGGSTMWGSCVGDEGTIPSCLARQLAAAGWRVEVVNLAQMGYVSTQERIALEQELARGRRLHLAVFYDGFNDIGAALANREAGLPADEFERPAGDALWHRPTLAGLAGHFLRRSALARLVQPSWNEQLAEQMRGNLAAVSSEQVAVETINRYLSNLRMVAALAEGLGFRAQFYWQPLLYSRAHPSADERALAAKNPGARDYHRRVYGMLREAEILLAGKDPALQHFRNLEGVFDDEPWREKTVFFDACHVARPGNEAIAREIARDLEPHLAALAAGQSAAAGQ